MRKVIAGRIYDTETATAVSVHDNNRSSSDFRGCREGLYRTKRGAWFVAGEGGPLTEYAAPAGDGWGWGEKITPLSDKEALEWLESHDKASIAERYFGEVLTEA